MVINPRFIKPLDTELIEKVGLTIHTFFTIEEHVLKGGFGEAMATLLVEKKMQHIQLVRLGIPDRFVEHGGRDYLLDKLGLTPQSLARKIIQSHTPISVS